MSRIDPAPLASLEVSDLIEAFEFLDDLRASGEANMFTEAQGHLFGVVEGWERPQVRAAHLAWMKTFSKTTTPDKRAFAALQSVST